MKKINFHKFILGVLEINEKKIKLKSNQNQIKFDKIFEK